MEARGTIIHAVSGVTLLFLIVGWFVLLGGVSRVQKVCDGRCRDRTGLYWWIIWFQFFSLLLWPVVQFVDGLKSGRNALIAIFSILATLQMLGADSALDSTDSGNYSSGYKATAAGFILLAIFNLVAILLLGFLVGESDTVSSSSGDVHNSGTTTYSNPVAKSGGSGVPDNNNRPFRSASNANNASLPASPPPPPNV